MNKLHLKSPQSPTVRVQRDILHLAKIVAAEKGMTLFNYLDGIMRPVVNRDFQKLRKPAG